MKCKWCGSTEVFKLLLSLKIHEIPEDTKAYACNQCGKVTLIREVK